MSDALIRARAYVDAGADGIMIHSRKSDGNEIFEFAKNFRLEFPSVPLVAVPTSYNQISENQLEEFGFNMVIYANHLLRGAYPAMQKVAKSILQHGRSFEIDKDLISVNEILSLIPGTR
jgi:phosphoenolpyruvate phosphomutase